MSSMREMLFSEAPVIQRVDFRLSACQRINGHITALTVALIKLLLCTTDRDILIGNESNLDLIKVMC